MNRRINRLQAGAWAIIVCMFFGFHQKPAAGFVINGRITGVSSGTAWLTHQYDYTTITDSTVIKDGQFILRGNLPEPLVCTLRVSGSNQVRIFFVENTTMAFEASLQTLHSATVTGGAANDSWNDFRNNQQAAIGDKVTEARRRSNKLPPQELAAIAVFKDSVMRVYVAGHPQSVVTAFLIDQTYILYPNYKMAGELYARLGDKVKSTWYARRILQNLEANAGTGIGKPAPGFALNDTSGHLRSLSSFKGQYVLIDFWASWCGPCRQETPFLVKAYNRFHAKGLEIIGVSLDENRQLWLNAILKDGLPWIQLSDAKGFAGPVSDMYGVKAIPRNFLLDATGKIIARDLRGEVLEKTLEGIARFNLSAAY
jgi:peroxiredoxin